MSEEVAAGSIFLPRLVAEPTKKISRTSPLPPTLGSMSHDLDKQPESAATAVHVPSDADLDLPVKGFKGTPDEIERQWFDKIYTGRGDRQKQLTVRAVLMGGVLGMFMSISNLYTTLKLGWSFGVAITACVLSFVIWNAIRAIFGGRLRPASASLSSRSFTTTL